MKIALAGITVLLSLTLTSQAAGQMVQTVTTSGAVQRLVTLDESQGVPRQPTQHTAVSSHTSPHAQGTPAVRHTHADTRQHPVTTRVVAMPQRITNSTLRTVERTTEHQLNSAIRREIRQIIRF